MAKGSEIEAKREPERGSPQVGMERRKAIDQRLQVFGIARVNDVNVESQPSGAMHIGGPAADKDKPDSTFTEQPVECFELRRHGLATRFCAPRFLAGPVEFLGVLRHRNQRLQPLRRRLFQLLAN